MVTIIISCILVAALFGFLFRDEDFFISLFFGLLAGMLVGLIAGLIIPAKFEEKVSSFPLEKVQYKTDTTGKYTFLEMETIEDEEYYIFYYYGDNGILEQGKFLTKNVSIKPGCDTAKVEFKKFSRDEDATINYFSIRCSADTEVTIYLPSCPIEWINRKLSLKFRDSFFSTKLDFSITKKTC